MLGFPIGPRRSQEQLIIFNSLVVCVVQTFTSNHLTDLDATCFGFGEGVSSSLFN